MRDYTKGHPTIAANNHPVRHGSVVGIHNGIISNDEALRGPRHGAARAGDDGRLGGDLRARRPVRHADGCPRAARGCDGGRLDRRARPSLLHVARGVGRPLWLGRGRHEVLFASTRDALEVVERRSARRSARPRSTRGGCSRSWTASSSRSAAGAPTGATARIAGRPSAPRTRAARASIASGRSPRPRPARSSGSRRARRPRLLAEPLSYEELERRPGARLDVHHAVDLPFGEERRVAGARVLPLGHLRKVPEPRASTAPSATARSSRSSPTGTSNRPRAEPPRASRTVCQMSDFEAIRPRRSSRSCRRDAAELGPELPELIEQLLAADEAPRREPGRALRGVPRAEVLDDGLRVDARIGVRRELPHRRRAAEPIGRRAELGEDLVVRVAAAHSRANSASARSSIRSSAG